MVKILKIGQSAGIGVTDTNPQRLPMHNFYRLKRPKTDQKEASKIKSSLESTIDKHSIIFEELPKNSAFIIKKELILIWDFKKNSQFNISFHKATKGSGKKAWRLCLECKSSYDMAIVKKVNGRGCPYCAGYRVNETNSLASLHPQLLSEWDFEENLEISPEAIVCGNTKKVWWKGKCGHSWMANTHNRVYGKTGCPYCVHNGKILKGFNDLETTHPKIAEAMVDKNLVKILSFGSSEKVRWKCSFCKVINLSILNDLASRGLKCKACSDSMSFGEKYIFTLLKNNEIQFFNEHSFIWSNNRRYDFYIPQKQLIIEVHGIQHYEPSRRGKRSFAQEAENDKKKLYLAKENGIKEYVVVNARESNVNWIANSVLNTSLPEIFDFSKDELFNLTFKHNYLNSEVWELWNQGFKVMQISRDKNISKNTVRRILLNGANLGICEYQ